MSFSLIAVRPLKGCDAKILKNLQEDKFYFFNNDYYSNNGEIIRYKFSKQNIPKNFYYKVNENSSLQSVNIQGLVGKNGEGKSSLVELLIRILNNFYKQYKIGNVTEKLIFVENLNAELYFEKDNVIYRIVVNSINTEITENSSWIDVRVYKGFEKVYDSNWDDSKSKKRSRDFIEAEDLFFSMYINYSIWALNENDYSEESKKYFEQDFVFNSIKKLSGIKSESWLTQIFHKNDGYQTPIVLHPFREDGNMNIENEKYLLSQRLISNIIDSSFQVDGNYHVTEDLVADKLILAFKQQDALEDFLNKEIKPAFLQQNEFSNAQNVLGKHPLSQEIQLKKFENLYHFLKQNENLLSVFRRHIAMLPGVSAVTDLYLTYLEVFKSFSHGGYEDFLEKSHPNEKIDYEAIKKYFDSQNWDKILYVLQQTEYLNFAVYNLFQVLTVYFNFWKKWFNINEDIFSWNNDRVFDQRLFIYIVMKSFKARLYPKYSTHNRWDTIDYYAANLSLNDKLTINTHIEFLKELTQDESHISVKLKQAIELLKLSLSEPDNDLISFYKGFLTITGIADFELLDKLITNNISPKIEKILLLPPRIFNTQILLKNIKENQIDIELERISSGEYQKITVVSSILYHLNNLDSVESRESQPLRSISAASNPPVYAFKNINIIFDEIELYFHPDFQRTFIHDLLNAISSVKFNRIRNISFLFITHSPFILSDIPTKNVLFLEKGKQVFPMSENTFASNIHSLLQHGFFLNSVPMGEFAKEKVNELFDLLNKGELNDTCGEGLYNQIMLVGEPFIKSQLLKLYHEAKGRDIKYNDIIQELRNEIEFLKTKINDKN